MEKTGVNHDLGRYDLLGKRIKKMNSNINLIELERLGYLSQIEDFELFYSELEKVLQNLTYSIVYNFNMNEKYEGVVIGAGVAGMMSAIEAGKRGRKTLLIDHSKKIGEKIRISGGGRCNFININTSPNKYISNNSSFIISALNQYNQKNFIDLVKR